MWYVFGAISLIGEILGFILLGCALWRAGTLPRWAAACISLGPLIHIAGGDIGWTATGGILLLALGVGELARVQLATTNTPVQHSPQPTRQTRPS
jgi:hypothetical protein